MATAPTTAPPEPASSHGLSLGDRLQPLLLLGSIGIGLGLAKAVPRFADALSPVVSGGVFLLIFLVMLGVDAGRIGTAMRQRRFHAIAVLVNFVVNPLVAWALSATFLQGHPDLQVGLILFLVTPCIGWYLVFTDLAGGDTGLGVGLLGINIVLQVLLLPVYLHVFVGPVGSVDTTTVVSSVLLFLVLPAVAAELARRWFGHQGIELAEVSGRLRLPAVKLITLAAVIVAMFASEGDVLFDNPSVVLRLVAPLLVFFALAFALAVSVGRVAHLPYDQTALLAFTSTSRNSEASLAIAATAFASPLVGLAVVVGPVVELPLLVVMVRLLTRRRDHSPESSPHHT